MAPMIQTSVTLMDHLTVIWKQRFNLKLFSPVLIAAVKIANQELDVET